MITKPLLKWVGGKTQIIEILLKKIPPVIENYHEIFAGGGSVFLAILSSKITIKGKINIYDLNKDLINFYVQVQKKPKEVLNSLMKLKDTFLNCKDNKIPKEEMKTLRNPKNDTKTTTAARMLANRM